MEKVRITLENVTDLFAQFLPPEQTARAHTLFLKRLASIMHRFYGGKMQTLPKAGVFGFNWFNVWYTPGISAISTAIRDNNDMSYDLTNRGNHVAVVSDSTRVLGDGDCSPPGGLGVMEGKAFLMKYLGGIDATALCIDTRDKNGRHQAEKIIEFVKMIQPSFSAVNLEDISQPDCYRVLDVLKKECDIPVWHDDAQGTACVTLAGLINALKLVDKELNKVRIVFLGAGASNTAIARIIIQAGGNPEKMIMFDSKASLHKDREDLKADERYYRKWELCEKTNPEKIKEHDRALKNADVLIALSTPGPDVVKPGWIKEMAVKPVVFACANPIPEIYPYAAKKAGAYIVATGRGDFPNQVNNSLGFPGILKGALLARARKISDSMIIAAAQSIAEFTEKRGINPDNIIARMDEVGVFPREAADVAGNALEQGFGRVQLSWDETFELALRDIEQSRKAVHVLIDSGVIKTPPGEIIHEVFEWTINEITQHKGK
ncbi:MAG: NADP-dependent malic enzyme [Spirochaetales bacterium]|nr:NADP-dependent malic enzyme [Spirochaetales bacterium]